MKSILAIGASIMALIAGPVSAAQVPSAVPNAAGVVVSVQPIEPVGYSYTDITSAATTPVVTGAGWLHAITINKPVASATIAIYDNTAGSGTLIGTITLPSTVTSLGPMTLTYDVAFSTGLTIVTSGATDITVSAR